MPDIDIDFCYERRGEVIDYTRDKYGKDAVGQIITFGTMKSRAVIRDVGRALGFEPSDVITSYSIHYTKLYDLATTELEHQAMIAELEIPGIDLVVVNLYPFARTIARPDCSYADAIENIDIGGPAMIRASAKIV